MNYSNFINKQIINKNNQIGTVISFDKEHIVIKYDSSEKTYNPDIALKNGFLTFIDDELNQLIKEDLDHKEIIIKEKEEIKKSNNQKCTARRKQIRKMFKDLYKKYKLLQSLFGYDFIYPPYEEFKKKYKYMFTDEYIHNC